MCSLNDCARPHLAKGLCQRHYHQQRRASLLSGANGLCAVGKCERGAVSKGWCEAHHVRWSRYGHPEAGQPERYLGNAEARLWQKVDKTPGCWLWTATVDHKGYGQFYDGTRLVPAHRFAYELLVGPIPDGLEIDHLCRVRNCVNPSHLEPVTHAENIRRRMPTKEAQNS